MRDWLMEKEIPFEEVNILQVMNARNELFRIIGEISIPVWWDKTSNSIVTYQDIKTKMYDSKSSVIH
ncbi:hypothetical protein G8O30_15110 [Mangrovibacillus cuniculi]|uniref:Uncharacterized protein n=2 Tax=Mangrovibacillus cuniculi TaxID=2593652 RepID=A0A7S8CDT7_9BACI|nr:hypothetical protein G8O30_15110 [Mangrovibacillus cuniculi]